MSVPVDVRKQANLRLLQRTCSTDIGDIVQTATHVVLYEFLGQAWQKSDVEGSLFLAVTASAPTAYYLIVLNRNSTDNFVMQVTDRLQLQHQDPYLIFRQHVQPPGLGMIGQDDHSQPNASGAVRIRGIWFHNANERTAMAAVLQETVQQLRVMSSQPTPLATPTEIPVSSPRPTTTASSSSGALSPGDAPNSSFHLPPHQVVDSAIIAPGLVADTLSSQQALPEVMLKLLGRTAGAVDTNPTTPTAASAEEPLWSSTGSPSLGDLSAPSPQPMPSVHGPAPAPGLTQPPPGGVALDKKSLQLALLSLIQDDRFLDLLHSQYLRVVHARAKKKGPAGAGAGHGPAGNNNS